MVTIEPGRIGDVDTVADLWVELAESQREFGSHLLADENRTATREAIATSAIEDELLVARRAETLVGFATFAVESGAYDRDVTQGVVQNIYVVPDARREGIGSRLLAEAERRLVERGVDAITLGVMADNDSARAFYRHHGYDPYRVELEKSVENDTLTKE